MSAFLKNMLTLYPGKSYVQNIGFDSEGTHCNNATNVFAVKLNTNLVLSKIEVKEDLESRKKIEKFLRSLRPNVFQKIVSKMKRLVK